MISTKSLKIGAYVSLALMATSFSYSMYNFGRLISQTRYTRATQTEPMYVATQQVLSDNKTMLESLSKLESELLTQAQSSTTADAPLKMVQDKKAKLRSESLQLQSSPLYQMATQAIDASVAQEAHYVNKTFGGFYVALPTALVGGALLDIAARRKRREEASVQQ